jgi:hypothetical protein
MWTGSFIGALYANTVHISDGNKYDTLAVVKSINIRACAENFYEKTAWMPPEMRV